MKILSTFLKDVRFYGPVRSIGYALRFVRYWGLSRVLGRRFLRTRLFGFLMDVDAQRGGISKPLYIYGPRELDLCTMLAEEIPVGGTVLDIGANIGFYALQEAVRVGPNGKVVAFEPDPETMRVLRRNARINGFEGRFEFHGAAVCETAGRVRFGLNRLSNLNRLLGPDEHVDRSRFVGVVDVPAVAIGDVVREQGRVDLVRMDIEGGEVGILKGIRKMLQEGGRPPASIVFETHPQEYAARGLDIKSPFLGLVTEGYRVKAISVGVDHHPEFMRSLGYFPAYRVQDHRRVWEVFPEVSAEDALAAMTSGGCARHVLMVKE